MVARTLFVAFVRLRGQVDRAAGYIYTIRKPILVFFAGITGWWMSKELLFEFPRTAGMSMYPTITDQTSIMFVNKRYRKGNGIQVGDCIQIANPIFPKELAGKRVIGLPGDYVLRSRNNSPTPGGAPLPGITDWKQRIRAEQEIATGMITADDLKSIMERSDQEQQEEWDEPEMIQVPEGHVWLEGDNQAWSRDSRFYGPVPLALIKGRSSWFKEGLLHSRVSLKPGKNLRKVEEWEKDAVLGQDHVASKWE